MKVSIQSRTYNLGGGLDIFSSIGALLTIRLGDYGKAVESIEIYAHVRSKRPRAGPLRDQFDQYETYLKRLPVVSFMRKFKRIEVAFLSEHLTAEDSPPGQLVVERCEVAMGEVAAVLSLIRKRVKPSDDFDVDRFLIEAGEILKEHIESSEEWDAIWQTEQERRLAKRATKDPWELLEIDWSRFHPKAREILNDPF